MRNALGTIAGLFVTLFLHTMLGWQWTLLGGVVAGLITVKKGWLWGGVGVAMGWGIVLLSRYVAASGALGRMLDTTGQILGNLPGEVVVVLTLLMGGILGMLGGTLGGILGGMMGRGERKELVAEV